MQEIIDQLVHYAVQAWIPGWVVFGVIARASWLALVKNGTLSTVKRRDWAGDECSEASDMGFFLFWAVAAWPIAILIWLGTLIAMGCLKPLEWASKKLADFL
jgi:hypothetical protein